MDIGTLEKYKQAHQDILNGSYPLPEFKKNAKGSFIAATARIHSTAKITAPVYIGENAQIDAYSVIGPNTIIGNNCKVGMNSKIINSIVWDKINIQSNSNMSGLILNSISQISNYVSMNRSKTEEKMQEGKTLGPIA